jgi:cysteine synthase A
MKVYNDITEIFGNTPLVRLNRMTEGSGATVLAKLEFYNPTSTVKDRIGIAMVDAAEKSGQLKETLESHSPWSEQRVVTRRS